MNLRIYSKGNLITELEGVLDTHQLSTPGLWPNIVQYTTKTEVVHITETESGTITVKIIPLYEMKTVEKNYAKSKHPLAVDNLMRSDDNFSSVPFTYTELSTPYSKWAPETKNDSLVSLSIEEYVTHQKEHVDSSNFLKTEPNLKRRESTFKSDED